MSSAPRLCLVAALAALPGCIEPPPEPASTAAARLVIPAVVDYLPDRVPAGTLFPDGVDHLEVVYTPGQVGNSYVWGIAGDKILWIYRVADGDGDTLDAAVHDAWRDTEQHSAHISFGGAGTVKGEIPKPPTPPGQPEFSYAYAERVVSAAQAHAAETAALLADLEALQ